MVTFWLQLMFFSASIQQVSSSGAGRHSLWMFATCISRPSQLRECSGVLMLDDLQVAYYDLTLDNLVISSRDRTLVDLGWNSMTIVRDMRLDMRNQLVYTKNRLNLTQGTVVQQRIAGCEIQDGRPTIAMSCDSYNLQDSDSLIYNMTHFTFTARDGWESRWDAARWPVVQTLIHHFYLPTCVMILKQLLDQKKNLVTRRVRPRFRVFSRQVNGGALLTCLATDFYPRHINLTLLRDGCQVEEDQLTSGPVLPNANGLYQARKTLALTEQELQQKHTYTCTATHPSLDNRLQVSWRAESYQSHRAHLVSPLVLVAVVLLLILVVVLVKCRRKRQEPVADMSTLEAESVAMVTQSTETERPPGGAP
ncbi:hereditary hemochromatosis protein homolog [Synchiropus splendidus]|uniref:hereditary hemochromatosis protein homolog n=1 Tax=Synchiropus splendidus TaxID=270530 RepID=UPI00237D6B48|nr:hereditary hemochromatosis protein homolog [Synchiropus splendidus]